MINKVAYAVGVAKALKAMSMLKIAVNDDPSIQDSKDLTPEQHSNSAEQLAEVFHQEGMVNLEDLCQAPDNITKKDMKESEKSVHWGPKIAPDGANSFGKYINATGSSTDYPTS